MKLENQQQDKVNIRLPDVSQIMIISTNRCLSRQKELVADPKATQQVELAQQDNYKIQAMQLLLMNPCLSYQFQKKSKKE